MLSSLILALLLVSEVTQGKFLPPRRLISHERRSDSDISESPADISEFNLTIFDQLIDHSNPSLGTFQQRVYSNDQYYAGSGSPVVFFSPGEYDASTFQNYMTNRKINGAIAEEIGGAIVMIEHRYFGESSPFEELSVKNLQYLTLNNSMLDCINIAKNIQLPFDPTNSSHPGVAPWVFVGGSYFGSLAVWTQILYPGTFWAYYTSGALVENVYDFWEYYNPIRQGMPANCSKDVELVTSHIDSVLSSGDEANITALKTMFGAEELEHPDDFAFLFNDGPNLWQSVGFYYYMGYTSFDAWCDYVETSASPDAAIPDENGVGLEKALAGYANWMKNVDLPGTCANYGYPDWASNSSLGCRNLHNATSPFYTDLKVNNTAMRQWMWLECSQTAGWQVGDGTPADTPAIVTRFLTAGYDINQCNLYFPPENDGEFTYNKAFVDSNYSVEVFQNELDVLNAWTKGWDIEGLTERVLFVVGEYDPWKAVTVASPSRPGGPINSTATQPIFVIPGVAHTSDLDMLNGPANAAIAAVQNQTIEQIKTWVDEYYKK